MHWPDNAFFSRWFRNITVVILVLVPFHAFLTVTLANIFGHYTAFRLWKEVLLFAAFCMAICLCVREEKLRKLALQPLLRKLLVLIGAYILVQLIAGSLALAADRVTAAALGYAFISNLRFLVFFVVCLVFGWLWGDWFRKYWLRLLLWPAAVVVGFGLLQFLILPADFLKHVGYGADTISPFIAVDQKPEYARAQSTLRGPNPLGAYLIMIVTALIAAYVSRRTDKKLPLLLASGLIVLIGTYSRSAWLGLVVALAVLAWALLEYRWRRWLGVALVTIVLVAAGFIFLLRDNDVIQNVVFHTDETSRAATSSNEDRANALTGGFQDMTNEPLGRGPGTAGPASVHNDGEARLAENYFLQVGQEVGVIGLVLFVAICGVAAWLLWQQRTQGPLPLTLLASFIGLIFVNLLSHAWADDTLAYVWWGFAGLAIGAYSMKETKQVTSRAKKAV